MNRPVAGFAAVLTLVIAGIALSARPIPRSHVDLTVEYMDRTARYYMTAGQFMGSVLVARGDEVQFVRSYGYADLERQIPNTPTTKFRIGSITKQFTAAAILLLEEQGKLHLEDPIRKHLPGAPPAWDGVTLFHLLTHTSGIPRGVGVPNEPVAIPLPDLEAHMSVVRDRPLEFKPGERSLYSNSGYVLLGYVIEQVSGQDYGSFLQEQIFRSLGMNDSGFDSGSTAIAGHAAGYMLGPGGPRDADFVQMSRVHAAGGIYSTVEDLLKWERGLFGGKVLSVGALQKMITPFKDDYGLGVHVETETIRGEYPRKRIHHSGRIQGFSAALAYCPDDDITVVVLNNLYWGDPSLISKEYAALAYR
jgi:CubicO group peptidase (beta-lactamase class C family)